eukprot:TRINITY_DN12063_c5_g1_i1.p1 TRINITY_DN12063_c5_g1~~TRINITY_DN12063_c5_g1_i1.p1  ORF type:complete len:221 (+),score=45.24 TRINITY_DN12063_c5_g1_i1:58-663(+)
MALARCWKHCAPIQQDLLREICDVIAEQAVDCDPRDLVAIPQHLGRLNYVHAGLLSISATAVSKLISSRLTVLPLDILRAMDGFLLLVPIINAPEAKQEVAGLATKCSLLGCRLLQQATTEDLWRAGSQLLGTEVTDDRVWSVWVAEAMNRRDPASARSRRVTEVRRRISKQWGIQRPPQGLELALQGALRPAMAAGAVAF